MAGQPKKRAMIAELERRSREYFEVEDGQDSPHSILDYVVAWIEGGKTQKELAFEVGTALGYEVGRERIGAYLRDCFGGEAETRLASARPRASHSMLEDAIVIVDAPADDSVDVARAASRARVRQRTAELLNPTEFGQRNGASVSISIGSLHLSALQSIPARVTPGVLVTPNAIALLSEAVAPQADSIPSAHNGDNVNLRQISAEIEHPGPVPVPRSKEPPPSITGDPARVDGDSRDTGPRSRKNPRKNPRSER